MMKWMMVAALALGGVWGCAEEEEAETCACQDGVCPEGRCDVSVTLAENCRGKVDRAEVEIDGEVVGEVTVDAAFRSCEGYACEGGTVEIVVRSAEANFTTGQKTVMVFLEPDVPIDCSNLP